MFPLIGYPLPLPPGLEFLSEPLPAFLINLLAWFFIALIVNFILLRILKIISRQFPGEVEDILLGIISRPIIFLILIFGINTSLEILSLMDITKEWINIISMTLVVIIITHVLGRFIKDIVVFYGSKWAARTETRVDDVLIPVLNLFGPLVLALTAALIILPLWGINVNSVLLGAGVLGLVLGLALQETLGNIFSGLSLLIEAPFRKGDLVLLNDGRTCEVLNLGMRSTVMFSLNEQATIYIPNKSLASTMLVNLTKPTPEQRERIELPVKSGVNLALVETLLKDIANGHPAVLSSNIDNKLEAIKSQVDYIRQSASGLPEQSPPALSLLEEAKRNEQNLVKLQAEGQLNHLILEFKEALRGLIRGITIRETKGLNEAERQELFCNFISPAEARLEDVLKQAKTWLDIQDAWLNSNDFWNQRKLWEVRNEQLKLHWERLKKIIYNRDDRHEMRLDDFTKQMLEWLEKEYKLPPGYWKNPEVNYIAIDGSVTHLQLSYYVDNIRLEHDTRSQRVKAELSRIIRERLTAIQAL